MSWISNTKKGKPEVDKKYKEKGVCVSIEVLIHLKNGLTFIGYYDYDNGRWYSEATEISDDSVMFWCKIPKLPLKKDKDEQGI